MAVMACDLVALTFDSSDPEHLARFWGANVTNSDDQASLVGTNRHGLCDHLRAALAAGFILVSTRSTQS